MNTLAHAKPSPLIGNVRFTDAMLCVYLLDGREVSAPLEWFPKLRDATEEERNDWRLIGGGIGIHWETLDEDLSVAGLLA
ncbi:MAG: DUF2442 domain-containing protein [Myxococcota bacterium]|nr:DUF2442 domain-containing protein [Myxococcota bacterium]